MRSGWFLTLATAVGLLCTATSASAAAFFIPVHDFRLGTCADGSACDWDCGGAQPECADGSSCRIDAQSAFSAALVVQVNDASDATSETGCTPTSGGSVVDAAFRILGEPDTLASGKLNLCGKDLACGCDIQADSNECALCPTPDDDACPPAQFLCNPDSLQTDFTEGTLLSLENWLGAGRQPLEKLLGSAISDQFPTGTALVYGVDSGSVEEGSPSSQPSVGRYCVRVLVTRVSKAICDPLDGSDCPICTTDLPEPEASTLTVSNADLAGCLAPACGDGFLDPGEACDDGDTDDGDGCSATCAVESCFTCSGPLGFTSSCQLAAPSTPCDADANACTIDVCNGSGQCGQGSVITTCTNGDGCCPAGCTLATDDDCTPEPTPWSSSGGLLLLAAALALVGVAAMRRSLRIT
jgi:cysteine-rich repeat protein